MNSSSVKSSLVRLSAVFLSILLYGCQSSTTDSRNQVSANLATTPDSSASGLVSVNWKDKSNMPLEKINGLTFDGKMLSFNVLSNGCTAPEDFRVDALAEESACVVTIVRTKPDLCKKATAPITVELPWAKPAECLDRPLLITNPLLEDKPRDASGLLPGAIK